MPLRVPNAVVVETLGPPVSNKDGGATVEIATYIDGVYIASRSAQLTPEEMNTVYTSPAVAANLRDSIALVVIAILHAKGAIKGSAPDDYVLDVNGTPYEA